MGMISSFFKLWLSWSIYDLTCLYKPIHLFAPTLSLLNQNLKIYFNRFFGIFGIFCKQKNRVANEMIVHDKLDESSKIVGVKVDYCNWQNEIENLLQ